MGQGDDINPQEFGRMQADLQGLRRDTDAQNKLLTELAKEVRAISDKLSEAKGGWKTLMLIGGAFSGVGALLAMVFDLASKLHR